MRNYRLIFVVAALAGLAATAAPPAAAGKPRSGTSYLGTISIEQGHDVTSDGSGAYTDFGGQFVADGSSDSLNFAVIDPRTFNANVRWSDGATTNWVCSNDGKAVSTIVISGSNWGTLTDAILGCGVAGKQYEVHYGTSQSPLCINVATTPSGWRFTTAPGCSARIYETNQGSKKKILLGTAHLSFDLTFTKY